MKKAVIGVLMVIMVLSVGVISAFATESEYGRNFVDADKNGICVLPGISAAMLTPTMMGYVIIVAPARTGVPTISQTQTVIVFVTIILAREWAKNVVSGADAISNRWQYNAERARSEQSNRAIF